MFRKAQAAMEFLMTYGWAILVVLVAVGALAYFGVLSPDNFLPNRCTLPSGIGCTDHKATSGSVEVVLRNGLGYDMTGISLYIPGCSGATAATPASANTLSNGDQQKWTATCSPAITTSKFSSTLNVSYTLSDTGLDHNAIGSIVSKVE